MMGGLVIIIVILSLLIMVLSWKIQKLYTELAEIKANIEQTPTQAKVLAKVKVMEKDGKLYIISKTNKAEVWQNTDKQKVMELK